MSRLAIIDEMNETGEPSQAARCDSFELLKAPYKDKYGRWIVEGIVARPGVYEYEQEQGVKRELITPQALSKSGFLKGLVGVPVVVEHPSSEVTPDVMAELRVGTCLEAKMIEDCAIWVMLVIDTPAGIDFLINKRIRGLSPHYYAQTEPKPGHHVLYGEHDSVQTSRDDPNHIALTEMPRGGYKTSVRLDSLFNGVKMDLLKTVLAKAGLDEAQIEAAVAELKAGMAPGETPEPAMADEAPAADMEDPADAAEPAADMEDPSGLEARLMALEGRLKALEDAAPVADAEEPAKDAEEPAVEDSKSTKTETFTPPEPTTDSGTSANFDAGLRALCGFNPLG